MLRRSHDGDAVAKPEPVAELPFEIEEPAPREYAPAAATFTCDHGVTFIGGDDDSHCEACYERACQEESRVMAGLSDFPQDSRFFDDEAQRDLAEYDASEFGLAMAANREARQEREAAADAQSAGLVRVARLQNWALKVTGAGRSEAAAAYDAEFGPWIPMTEREFNPEKYYAERGEL